MSEAVRRSALILAIALAAAGCSRDDSSVAPVAPNANPLVSSVAEPAAPASAVSQPPALPSALDVVIEPHTGDLDEIVKRRQIRMLVTIDRTHFFFDGAVQKGIVADAVAEFDRWLNQTLETPKNLRIQTVVVPVRRDQLLPALLSGRGDVIAVYVTDTPERRKHVAFADAGFKVSEVFVANAASTPPTTLDDLSGREVWVRRGGVHHESLTRLNEQLAARSLTPVDIRELDAAVETDEALEMVNAGLIPATVADRYVARLWASVLPDVRVYDDIRLRVDAPFTWAVRKEASQLQALVGRFQKTHGEGTLWGNMKFKEYFAEGRFIRNPGGARDAARFRQTRSLFERYANQYSLDWLLITAQGYQESGLDQSKRSHVGAIGVMQLMPATARDPRVAIPEIQHIERNIEAGVKYLRVVIDEYYADEPMSQIDKTLFALASYNAGPARISKLRAEAVKLGLDPNVWFENVEIVAARRIGAETVTYVRNIHKYYIAYKLLEEQGRMTKQASVQGTFVDRRKASG